MCVGVYVGDRKGGGEGMICVDPAFANTLEVILISDRLTVVIEKEALRPVCIERPQTKKVQLLETNTYTHTHREGKP